MSGAVGMQASRDPAAPGEFELIRRYFDRGPARRVDLGIGDDCALLRPLPDDAGRASASHGLAEAQADLGFAVSTDMLVAGRHFFDDVDPHALGHKALAVNLSDLAAMAARPRAFLLAIALPQPDTAWLERFACGLFELADRSGCELVGGDVTRGPLNLCLTVFGDLPVSSALRRDRAEPQDDVWVSGELGAAAHAVRARLAGQPLAADHPAWQRLHYPEPRVALGLSLRHLASAAIDLSDGLAGDLGHIAERSRVGIEIDWPSVPVAACLSGVPEAERRQLALGGGDDYELAFTAPADNRLAIEALAARVGSPLARIGRVTAGAGVTILDSRGQAFGHEIRSFDHFAAS